MKQITPTKKLLEQFRNDPKMLIFEGMIKNAPNTTLYHGGKSYALFIHHDTFTECCISTSCPRFLGNVIKMLSGRVEFRAVDAFVLNYLQKRYQFLWQTDCYLYVWDGKPLTHVCQGDLRPLDAQYSQLVSDGTPYKPPVEEVAECLVNRPSSALFIDGQPVCWCLLHMENSLGMLYTLPQHRKKGYALHVMTHLTNQVIASGNIPYAYIIQDNVASQNLASKYNLQKVASATFLAVNLPQTE